jgi:nucleoside-triphosphatase THEP1
MSPAAHIFIVTGRVQGGKTTFTAELVEALKQKGLHISGFLSRGTFRDGKRDSFILAPISGGKEIPLATDGFREGWSRYRRFCFNPRALEKGTEMVLSSLKHAPDLVVIDEVGPMELEGLGWSSLLQVVADADTVPQVWVARNGVVDAVTERWAIPRENVYPIDAGMDPRIRKSTFTDLLENIVNFDPLH